MKYAFFLGAGASKTCGAPLQGEMMKEYFSSHRDKSPDNDINKFFYQFFGIDLTQDVIDFNTIDFPTFEEILGIIDLAIARKETFRNFQSGNQNLGIADRLSACRDHFVGLMALVLEEKLSEIENNHEELIRKLQRKNMLKESIFISTNYDILIDNAIMRVLNGFKAVDYGFEFTQAYLNNKKDETIPLFKLHGSLNWLYCPTCKSMELTPLEKGAVKYYNPINMDMLKCRECGSMKQPVIIPPTYFKDYMNYFIEQVWYKAEQALKEVEKIFFCGYSFPDADIHIKYLLKRVEANKGTSWEVKVINNFPHKSKYAKDQEKSRYQRFFWKDSVEYTDMSFENLIDNLDNYI